MHTAIKVRKGPGMASARGGAVKPPSEARVVSRDETVGFLLWDTQRTVSREFEKLIAPHGIGLGTFWILRILWDEDGITQSQLIERGRMRGPTIVAAVAQLERDGFVTRADDPADSRKKQISLTPKGDQLRRLVLPLTAEMNRRSMKGFSAAERTQFKQLLRRARANVIAI